MAKKPPASTARCRPEDHGVPAAVPYDDETYRGAAAIFRALGDAGRLQLLAVLLRGKRCVSELAAVLEESLPLVSQRLRLLRSEKIVTQERDGKHVYYALADQHVRRMLTSALDHACEDRPAAKTGHT